MDQKLKERLLGAVIILSVLIFFLPMLFKQNRVNLSALNSEFSEQEVLANSVALEEKLKELELEKEYLNKEASSTFSSTQKVKKTLPVPVVSKEVASMWVLRIGVFSDPNNAKLLVENLLAKGYPSYAQVDTSQGAKITRVFIGPKKTEFEIKKIRDKMKHDLKIQGIVMQYPEKGATA